MKRILLSLCVMTGLLVASITAYAQPTFTSAVTATTTKITITFNLNGGGNLSAVGAAGLFAVTGATISTVALNGTDKVDLNLSAAIGVNFSCTNCVTLSAAAVTNGGGASAPAGPATFNVTDGIVPVAPSTPDMTSGTDLGVLNTDNVTKDNTPDFTGTAEANQTVNLYRAGSTLVGTGVADGAGSWTITVSTLTDGTHTITARTTDGGSNQGPASSGLNVSIDTGLPAAPATPNLDAVSDTGTSSTDNLTKDTNPAFSGTAVGAVSNFIIRIYSNHDNLIGTATASGTGSYTAISTTLVTFLNSTHSITATAEDIAGNEGPASSGLTITMDTTAPIINTVTSNATLAGVLGIGGTIQFTADISVTEPGLIIAPAAYNTQGITWSAVSGGDTYTATYTVTLTNPDQASPLQFANVNATDAAGNTSGNVSGTDVLKTIDANPPAAPSTPDMTAGTDLGLLSTDNITKDNTPDFSGTAEANATVNLYRAGSTLVGTGSADGAGAWTITVGTLTDGAHTITARATDAAGNQGVASAGLGVNIDTGLPAAPNTPNLDAATDTGTSSTDNLTKNTTPTFSGTAVGSLANFVITMYSNRDGAVGTGTFTGTGAYNTIGTTLLTFLNGTHDITATATDVAGNEGPASTALTITLDTTLPVINTVTSNATVAGVLGIGGSIVFTADISVTEPGLILAPVTYNTVGITWSAVSGGDTYTATYTVGPGNPNQASPLQLLNVTATDAAGNASIAVSGSDVAKTIDANAPVAPSTPDMTPGTDTNITTDNVTFNNTPTFTGTAEANSTVNLYRAGATLLGTVAADGAGAWSITSIVIPDGTHTITARATDAAGNQGVASTGLVVTIDILLPPAPGIPDLDAATDTFGPATGHAGTSADNITRNTTPTFTSSSSVGGVANATIRIISNRDGQVGSGTANGSGAYSSIATTLVTFLNGTHTITATAMDLAGNIGPASAGLIITEDTTAPTVLGTPVFSDGGSGSETVTITFSENIDIGNAEIIANNTSAQTAYDGFHPSVGDIKDANSKFATATPTLIVLTSVSNNQWSSSTSIIYNKSGSTANAASNGHPNYIFDAAGNELATITLVLSDTQPVTFGSGFVFFPNAGAAETIVFQMSEELNIPNGPVLGFQVNAVNPASAVYSGKGTTNTITLTAAAHGTWTEGALVSYSQGAGNVIDLTGSGSNELANTGGTGIRLITVNISSNNVNGFTNRAKPGDIVTVSYTRNNGTGPTQNTVKIDNMTATVSGADPNYTAALTTSAANNTGTLPFAITFVTATDSTVVNSATNVPIENTVLFDKTPPSITPVTISSNNAAPALAKPGDIVTLLFTVNEPLFNLPVVTIDGKPATVLNIVGNDYSATLLTDGTDNNGVMPFNISLQDQVGNVASATATTNASSVTFDKTLPFVSTIAIFPADLLSPTIGTTNGTNLATLRYTVTFNEPVTGVDVGDFVVTPSGFAGNAGYPQVSANLLSVTGGPTAYTVTVNTAINTGTLALDFVSDGTVLDLSSNINTASFNTGATYSRVLNEPTNNVTLLSASTPNSTSVTLNWTNPIVGQLPTHLLILGIQNSVGAFPTPTDGNISLLTPDVNFNDANGGVAIVDLTVIATTNSINIPGLNSGQLYTFRVYPYTLSPNNSNDNVNYKTTATPQTTATPPPGAAGSITAGGTLGPLTISSLTTSFGAVNFSFRLQDDGTNLAVDNSPTLFNQLIIKAGTGSTVTNWAAVIAQAELREIDENNASPITTVTIGPSSITFSGISTLANGIGALDDNEQKQYQLRIRLNTNLPVNVDNQIFNFLVDVPTAPNSFAYDPGSSTIESSQAQSSGVGRNQVTVSRTALAFKTQAAPTNPLVLVNLTTNPIVEAVDANGNRDTDFNLITVNFTNPSSIPMLPGSVHPLPVTAINGVITIPAGFQYTDAGNGTLTATGGGFNSNSGAGFVSSSAITVSYSSLSTIIPGPLVEPLTISSTSNTAPGVDVFDFRVVEDNGAGGDGSDSRINRIRIIAGPANSGTLSNWADAIAGATLTDNFSNTFPGVINAADIDFNGLNVTTLGLVTDGTTKTYRLTIYLRPTLLGGLQSTIDTKNFDFQVTTATVFTTALSSAIAGAQSVTSGAGRNVVDVAPTRLVFSTDLTVSPLLPDKNLSLQPPVPVITVRDDFGNTDLNYTAAINIAAAVTTSITSIAASDNASPNGGVYSFPGTFQFNQIGSGTLTVSSGGLIAAVSSPVSISTGTASTITAGAAPSGTISSLINLPGAAQTVFNFVINDDPGGTPANQDDGSSTLVTQMIITQKAVNNTIADWSQAIQDATLTDGTNNLVATSINPLNITFSAINAVVAKSGSITSSTGSATVTGVATLFTSELAVGQLLFNSTGTTLIGTISAIGSNTSLTLTGNAGITLAAKPYGTANLGLIPDNGSKTYSLRIRLKAQLGGQLPITIDGLAFGFDIQGTNVSTNSTGSSLLTSPAQSANSGAANVVTVGATKLTFSRLTALDNFGFTATTGTITASLASTTVTGVGTLFTSELVAGQALYSSGSLVGTIASIGSATSLTLASNSLVALAGVPFSASNPFPPTGSISSPFNPRLGIEAQDVNGNRDLGFTSSISSVTVANSLGVSNPPAGAFAAGALKFPVGFVYTSGNNQNGALTVTAGSVTSTSTVITISSSSDSYVYFDPTFTYQNLNNSVNQQSASLPALINAGNTNASAVLARFVLSDGGASNFEATSVHAAISDSDGADTNISSIQISVTNPGDLRTLALYDAGGNKIGTEQSAAATVTFGGLNITATDNLTNLFTIRTTFAGTIASDHDLIQLAITAVTHNSGSLIYKDAVVPYIGGVFNGDIVPSTFNNIDVVATKLVFQQQPPLFAGIQEPVPYTLPPGTIGPATVVRALDANNNLDLDFDFPTYGTRGDLSSGASLTTSSFPFALGVLDLANYTYSGVGDGTLTISATTGLPQLQLGVPGPLIAPPTNITSTQVDVIDVNATIATGGIIAATNLASGAVNKVIFGVTFNAIYHPGAEPKLGKFTISFGNIAPLTINQILTSVRIFENASATFGGTDVTSLGGSVNQVGNDYVITFPPGFERPLATAKSYFLLTNIVGTTNGSTPPIQPQVIDAGYGTTTDTNIGTTKGSATANVIGKSYNFSAIFPPTLASSYPANSQLNIDPNQPLISMTFSVPVWTLNDKVYLHDQTANSPVVTLTASNGSYLGGTGTRAQTIYFNLPDIGFPYPAGQKLIPDHVYYITADPGVFNGATEPDNTGFMDQAGNLFSGISYPGTFFFKAANPNPPNLLASPIAASDPTIKNASITGATISTTFDQPGKAYFLVLPAGTATPSLSQIKGTLVHPSARAQGNYDINQINPTSQFGAIVPTLPLTALANYDVWISAESYSEINPTGNPGGESRTAIPAPSHYGGIAKLLKTGTILTSTASTAVTGTGTLFLTQLAQGRTLFDATGTSVIGTIASITSNTSLTLTAKANTTTPVPAAFTASGFGIGDPGPTLTFSPPNPSPFITLNVPAISICNNAYQILNEPIIITESSAKTDFQGPNATTAQVINLVLPAGFVFDISMSGANPVYGNLILTGADFPGGGSPLLSFVGNTILTVSFKNFGNSSIDNITITGLRVLATATASGSIKRFGGNAIAGIADLTALASIGSFDQQGITFTNSYSLSQFNSTQVTTIPDDFPGFTAQLFPIAPYGDFGPSSFSGPGVNLDLLNLNGVTKGVPFNITINHSDNNGCPSQGAEQYFVYDHTKAIKDLAPEYCSPNNGASFSITNTSAPAPIAPAAGSITHLVTFNNLQAYYLDTLRADVPSTALPFGTIDPVTNKVSVNAQIIHGPNWQSVLRSTQFLDSIPIPSGRPVPNLPGNNPKPGHPYFDYTIDEAFLWNANSVVPGTIPIDLYDYFKQNTTAGNTYFTGGSLGVVAFTGVYQSIANVNVTIPLIQNVRFFIPPLPIIETSSSGGFDNPGPTQTPVFCQEGGTIAINGFPAASAGSSVGRFTVFDDTNPGVMNLSTIIYDNPPPGAATSWNPGDAIVNLFPGGFTDNTNGTASLNPKILDNAYKAIRIVYYYKEDISPCSNIAQQVIRISPNPIADFSYLTPLTPYTATTAATCAGQPISFTSLATSADPLTGGATPGTGILTYSWNFGDAASATNTDTQADPTHTFDAASLATPYQVSFSVTSIYNCPSLNQASVVNTEVKPIAIGDIPDVKFKMTGVSINDTFTFQSVDAAGTETTTSANDRIVQYDWDFGNGTLIRNDVADNLPTNDDFNDDVVNNNYTIGQIGPKSIDLTVTTLKGCVNKLSLQNTYRSVVVLPFQAVTPSTAYTAHYEGTDDGWQVWNTKDVATGQISTSIPSWIDNDLTGATIIQPDPINGIGFWKTNDPATGKYNGLERSALYSPSFDLQALQRPMVSFNAFVQMVNGDGVVLQYSIDDLNVADPLKVWSVLGTVNDLVTGDPDGVDWYTDQGISASPGEQSSNFGWSNSNKGFWQEPKHVLDPVAAEPKVVFRFALASGTSSPSTEGFAMDNFRIGERTRTILLESFTNAGNTDPNENIENTSIISFPNLGAAIGTEVVKLNYHVSFPDQDPFNLDNPNEPSSRALFYNIATTPISRLDGKDGPNSATTPNELFSTWGDLSYNTRTLVLGQADILIRPTAVGSGDSLIRKGGKLSFFVDVTPHVNIPSNSVLHVVVTEQQVPKASLSAAQQAMVKSGETDFGFVVKKMLPDATGTRTSTQALPTDNGVLMSVPPPGIPNVYTFGPFEWVPNPLSLYLPNVADMAIAVFLQQEDTKIIYQAEIVKDLDDPKPNLVTGLEPIPANLIHVYPVPADKEMTIQLPGQLQEKARLLLFDQVGRITHDSYISEGTNGKTIGVEEFAAGVYILQIETGPGMITRKKVMVVH